MNFAPRNAIASPASGLIIWCINCAGYGQVQVYNGTTWTNWDGGEAGTIYSAFVGPSVWKIFMSHNLGANTALDLNTPVQEIHGNYYQWGRSTVFANASTPSTTSPWNTIPVADKAAWSDATKNKQ